MKREILTDGGGVPLSVSVDGANRHDKAMLEETLMSVQVVPKDPGQPQNLCLDKAFDAHDVPGTVEQYGAVAHVRRRGEEIDDKRTIPGYRARRWVVERTHSWMNRYRALLIRWEKKKANYLGLLYLACALITFKAAGIFG